jgi:hypothetical protein
MLTSVGFRWANRNLPRGKQHLEPFPLPFAPSPLDLPCLALLPFPGLEVIEAAGDAARAIVNAPLVP